jgi:hypothetical protein
MLFLVLTLSTQTRRQQYSEMEFALWLSKKSGLPEKSTGPDFLFDRLSIACEQQ